MHHHELTAAPTHTGSTYPPASGYAYEVHLSIPPDRQRTYSFAHTLHSSAHTHTRMHTRARTQVHTQTHTTRVVHAPATRPHRAHQQRGQQRNDQLPCVSPPDVLDGHDAQQHAQHKRVDHGHRPIHLRTTCRP